MGCASVKDQVVQFRVIYCCNYGPGGNYVSLIDGKQIGLPAYEIDTSRVGTTSVVDKKRLNQENETSNVTEPPMNTPMLEPETTTPMLTTLPLTTTDKPTTTTDNPSTIKQPRKNELKESWSSKTLKYKIPIGLKVELVGPPNHKHYYFDSKSKQLLPIDPIRNTYLYAPGNSKIKFVPMATNGVFTFGDNLIMYKQKDSSDSLESLIDNGIKTRRRSLSMNRRRELTSSEEGGIRKRKQFVFSKIYK